MAPYAALSIVVFVSCMQRDWFARRCRGFFATLFAIQLLILYVYGMTPARSAPPGEWIQSAVGVLALFWLVWIVASRKTAAAAAKVLGWETGPLLFGVFLVAAVLTYTWFPFVLQALIRGLYSTPALLVLSAPLFLFGLCMACGYLQHRQVWAVLGALTAARWFRAAAVMVLALSAGVFGHELSRMWQPHTEIRFFPQKVCPTLSTWKTAPFRSVRT